MSTRVLQPKRPGSLVRHLAPRLAAASLACTLVAGCAMGQGVNPAIPNDVEKTGEKAVEKPVMNAPADMIEAALADAANRSTTAQANIKVLSAEAVTWPDGSLGCPKPGMMYTQALVPGFRIRIRAGAETLDYHAGRRGAPMFCPAGRAVPPVSGDAAI